MIVHALRVDVRVPEAEQPQVLYRLRRLFYAEQKGVRPTTADLNMEYPALLPYAAQQWFALGREGAAFAAFDALGID